MKKDTKLRWTEWQWTLPNIVNWQNSHWDLVAKLSLQTFIFKVHFVFIFARLDLLRVITSASFFAYMALLQENIAVYSSTRKVLVRLFFSRIKLFFWPLIWFPKSIRSRTRFKWRVRTFQVLFVFALRLLSSSSSFLLHQKLFCRTRSSVACQILRKDHRVTGVTPPAAGVTKLMHLQVAEIDPPPSYKKVCPCGLPWPKRLWC